MTLKLRCPFAEPLFGWLAANGDQQRTPRVSGRRSVAKAVTYRALVVAADFLAVFVLTGALRIAVGFTIISNIYTTVIYIVHERVWARSNWGLNQLPVPGERDERT